MGKMTLKEVRTFGHHPKPDDEKLRELILFVSMRSEGDAPFGAVKLNKILFYADFIAYSRYGKSITGQEYQALKAGPAPRRLLPVVRQMKKDEDLGIRENDYFGHKQYRSFALRQADTRRFRDEELRLVEEIIEMWRGKTATEMSDKSHKFIGWQLAKIGETIPYSVALISNRKPNDEERAYALQHLEAEAQALLVNGS